ncbi:MAG TPA: hypothetical protein VN741_16475 [Mycobacterium sp.]|jgi:hypothetical protein|nr:hypothetical protein [Mycobacterium sp.]
MGVKHRVAAAVIATATLAFGSGIAVAAPLDPPPPDPNPASPAPPLKAMKCWPYGRVGPGSARGGGGVPVYPPPCPPGTPH